MNKITAQEILSRLEDLGDPERARDLQRFFKTGPGEYGEGDVFAGLRVPEIRKLAREYQSLPLSTAVHLLHSPIHEARLLALLIMVRAYRQGDAHLKEQFTISTCKIPGLSTVGTWWIYRPIELLVLI